MCGCEDKKQLWDKEAAKTKKRIFVLMLALFAAVLSAGCQDEPTQPTKPRVTRTTILMPEATGEKCYGENGVSIDASHITDGYIMVQYAGDSEKAKVQITVPDGSVYTYTILGDSYETIPISSGSGKYQINVLEQAYDNMYALLFSADLEAELSDGFKPFLYPNQYVWFTEGSKAVELARQQSEQSSGDLDFVARVYHYVIGNIVYDTEKAKTVSTEYIPDVDAVLAEGKGICFDYASLMAAMLRSQGIPTKLQIGYSGQTYHAWISVYIEEAGWIDKAIRFDGKEWTLMDPTLAASNDAESVRKYVGDGTNYTVKYSY